MTAPINTNTGGDIQQALNTFVNGDIGNTITVAAQNGKVNKWAKYKPYRSYTPITSAQDRVNANYGLSIQHFNEFGTNPANLSSFIGKLVHQQLGWDYLVPRGNTVNPTEYFRMMDFAADSNPTSATGYNANANSPVGDVERIIPVDLYGNATITWDYNSQQNAGSISMNELVVNNIALSQFYLGVVLYRADDNFHYITSTTKLGNLGSVQGIGITLVNATPLTNGNGVWRAFPFFSSTQIAYDASVGTGNTFFSAAWDNSTIEMTFYSTSESIVARAFATWNSTHTGFTYYFVVTNNASGVSSVSLNLFVRRNQDSTTEPSDVADTLWSTTTSSINVSAGQTYTSETFFAAYTPQSDYESYYYWIGASINGYSFAAHYTQFEEDESLPEAQ